MSELKDVRHVKKGCHFCKEKSRTRFQFDLRRNTIDNTKRSVPVCTTHFQELCDTVYTILGNDNYKHFPSGQREYVAVKHLESKLDVKNTIQFNK
jgi:hypothetical protein